MFCRYRGGRGTVTHGYQEGLPMAEALFPSGQVTSHALLGYRTWNRSGFLAISDSALSPAESSTHGRPFTALEYVVQRPVDDRPTPPPEPRFSSATIVQITRWTKMIAVFPLPRAIRRNNRRSSYEEHSNPDREGKIREMSKVG